ncbi:NACHT domain-containing protein [Phytohabitans rumicis]|uniref:ATP-binding protein n=1 Tax=Phytohabitans rumicis TaxID=1076125 RepID=A0A6V8LJS4_9ACTN|nr:NACHT domain-containing protein [Phytohabitans rumicis]GFJ94426.1 ATP-binding protein [Phytohabitans rumicis]
MTTVEAALVKVGQAVVVPAFRWWLAERRRREEATLPLGELINRRFTDGFARRKLEREVAAMTDAVAERLAPLQRAGDLPDHERRAALDAVVDAFTVVAADEALFAADADGARLAALIRVRAADRPDRAGLSDAAARLYDVVLDECCDVYVRAVVHLASFAPRATAEVLSRLAGQAEQLAQILARLPVRSLDAPAGTGEDEQFRHRYLSHLSSTLDEMELFGVDVRNYRPRATLSVAYVSLAVSADAPARRRGGRDRGWTPGLLRGTDPDRDATADASVRVEQALARSHRTLLRGEAGSGKTTVLKWLAVTAARAAFAAELTGWNGHVPFLVVLRRYVDEPLPRPEQFVAACAPAIAGLEPPGWAHRRLASGHAVLLVDGVDELTATARRHVRDWLRDLLAAYPEMKVVVTSRPPAAAGRWLAAERFGPAMLERMSPADVRALIAHWHRAVRDGDLPCPPDDLPRYENALVGRLDANTHLQGLATSPLLCAMLCALNLDRRTHLPRDRMSLYAAAVDLLLERRDEERDIAAEVALSGRDKLQLIQYLAWRMSLNNEAEIPQHLAVARLGEKREAMPQVAAGAQSIFEHLLHRSGLLREPVAGRVDFVHRTFQEYLTAREAADRADVGMLVEKAHRDAWRDVVVMAAGHANGRVREDLLAGVLDRADAEPAHRRALRLVAAACLETVPALDPELLDRVRAAIDALVPPRGRSEARSLAGVGEPLLHHLPRSLAHLSEPASAGTVLAAALVNGPEALDVLAGYAADPRPEVQRHLASVWTYFDPEEYARRVLADAPLVDGTVSVSDPLLLPAVRHLRRLAALDVVVTTPLDLAALDGVPHLHGLHLHGGTPSRLDVLRGHRDLRELVVHRYADPADPAGLAALTQLRTLNFYGYADIDDLSFLWDLGGLERLGLSPVRGVTDFAPLAGLDQLVGLTLGDPQGLDYASLPAMSRMEDLWVSRGPAPDGGLAGLIALAPHLRWLGLPGSDWLTDLAPLAGLTGLTGLGIGQTAVSDLSPLAGLHLLDYLNLGYCREITDLTPLRDLRRLRDLYVYDLAVDLAPLAHHRHLTIYASEGRELRGVEQLGPGVKLRYV